MIVDLEVSVIGPHVHLNSWSSCLHIFRDISYFNSWARLLAIGHDGHSFPRPNNSDVKPGMEYQAKPSKDFLVLIRCVGPMELAVHTSGEYFLQLYLLLWAES